jgi:hypothetical protein
MFDPTDAARFIVLATNSDSRARTSGEAASAP